MPVSRVRRLPAAAVLLILASAAGAAAQLALSREFSFPARMAPEVLPDADFVICRLMYTQVRREAGGGGWRTDYPDGEMNLTTRLSEMTRTRVSRQGDGQPSHWVVPIASDTLFQCPVTMASDAGTIGFQTGEPERLRAYLLKGGFLWVDDFWGPEAWLHWQGELRKVLPAADYTIEELPLDDALFRAQLEVTRVPQVANIGFWRRTGGETAERGADSPRATLRVVRDAHGRVMVVMTHNTDIADAWEREAEDRQFFQSFSGDAYALGINVILHVLTH